MSALYLTGTDIRVTCASRHLDIARRNRPGAPRSRIPLGQIDRVCLAGRPSVSMRTVEQLMERGIPVALLSGRGHLTGQFLPGRASDAAARIRQYRAAGMPVVLDAARNLVAAKILNQRRTLQKLGAGRAPLPPQTMVRLAALAKAAASAADVPTLRGTEGRAARLYFDALSACFPLDIPFSGRSRRPPKDAANALLSWIYTLVLHEVRIAVAACGLDPCIGILHALAVGRPALALDLLEPFRAPLCDRFALRLLNLKILTPADFEPRDGGVFLRRAAWPKFFAQYEKYMEQKPACNLSWRQRIRAEADSWFAALKDTAPFSPFRME